MAEHYTLTDEDLRAVARHWLSTRAWQDRLAVLDDMTPGILRSRQATLAQDLLEAGATDNEMSAGMAAAHEAAWALDYADYDSSRSDDLDRCRAVLMQELQGHVDRRLQQVFRPEELAGQPSGTVSQGERGEPLPAAKPKASPKVLERVQEWQTATEKGWGDFKPVEAHTVRQYGVAVRLFSELIGNRPVAEVTREDAALFRSQLLRLPATLGKGRPMHALKAIEKADKTDAARMTMKTVKRHMTALNRYWAWLQHEGDLPDVESPFSRHHFPGTKSKKSARDDWSAEYLKRLLTSADYRAASKDSALHWLPLVALHTGMRLEEICRLRPTHDVIRENGIPCIIVQPHPDGWNPKSEAGERKVPVHSWLIRHGFLELVERRRKEGSERLFSDLRPDKYGKLSPEFSREFSRLKTGIGVGRKTTFHSFRHTFRTFLESTDFQERHIDAVLGHEGGGGEGRTYAKRVTVAKLRDVVESFESPLPLDFLEAGRLPKHSKSGRG